MPPPPPAGIEPRADRVGPKFDRLREVLERNDAGLELRADPTALAPETIIVFELTGQLRDFAKAVARVPGLRMIGEEDGTFFEGDDGESEGALYLTVPDATALRQILRLWDLHNEQRPLGDGHREWTAVFACLHDVRRWGPRDRVTDEAAAQLLDALDGEEMSVELELMSHGDPIRQGIARAAVAAQVDASGGRVVRTAFIPQIGYDALLVLLPAEAVRSIAQRQAGTLADDPEIFAIRPQSYADAIGVDDGDEVGVQEGVVAGLPIVGILDAVPVANHRLLAGRIIVDDPDNLAARAAGRREHGTAMASLAVWGDIQADLEPLLRPVFFRPLLFASADPAEERFPVDRLIVEDVVRAVRGMFDATNEGPPSAPSVLVVSISLGDATRPFAGRMSPWARALDWLSTTYGVLFLVSAGNVGTVVYGQHANEDAFRAVAGADRSRHTLEAMRDAMPHRRIISPAESVNALTIGASHLDQINGIEDVGNMHDPLPLGMLPSPASRHGPGYRNSVKPEVLAPGGRVKAALRPLVQPATLRYGRASALGGLEVAGPLVNMTGWSGYTSGATALAARSACLIHDALEAAYGDNFTVLPRERKALILKALLVHRADVPQESKDLALEIYGPADARQHQKRSANLRRLFGYGFPDWDEVQACVTNRATVWGHGTLGEDEGRTFSLPIPVEIYGNRLVRKVSATLAWFSPIEPGMRDYKAVRLQIEEPEMKASLGIAPLKGQTQKTEASRGTTFHRCWEGKTLRAAVEDAVLPITISRRPDTADDLPGAVAFGLVVTIESEGDLNIYQAVSNRLAVRPRVPAPVGVPG